MTASTAAARMPEDLQVLVSEVAVPLVGALLVTTLPSPRVDRACWRLTFADGRVLKGRYVETVEQADRLEALTRRLDHRSFPPVLSRYRRALLTAWVDGTPLDRRRWSTAMLGACGAVHGAVHRTRVESRPAWYRRHGDWHARLESRLRDLVDARVIEAVEARRAETLAGRFAPEAAASGLCHGDFCAENIIVDGHARPVVVDNDSIAVDAYGYDLARTWHRWPMTEAQSHAYMAGYGPAGHLAEVEAHFVHWAAVVLVEAAAFRVQVGLDGADVPLRRLHALLQAPHRYGRFPGLVPRGARAS